jgi:LuxR family maltose regulon positive regulatory protein
MSSLGAGAPTLIQTKLHRPRIGQDLISRPHLIQQLNQGVTRKLTLISAQAGAAKSTLIAQWLQACPRPIAWLSLDEDDNDLMVFASYLCAAIQSVFPDACEDALDLLNAPVTPLPRIIMTSLVNELDALCRSSSTSDHGPSGEGGDWGISLIIALDDYHTIKEPIIHELVSELVRYLPQYVHLVLSTRTDPPLPLARLRARQEMRELRTKDLQLRAALDPLSELNEAGKPLLFSVELVDRNGQRTEVSGLELAYPPGTRQPNEIFEGDMFTGHLIMKTVQIPLEEFSDIDLTSIAEITLHFDHSPSGALFIADLELIKGES